jgi:hypothetical protein
VLAAPAVSDPGQYVGIVEEVGSEVKTISEFNGGLALHQRLRVRMAHLIYMQ